MGGSLFGEHGDDVPKLRVPSQNAELLRKHHVDKGPISDLCDPNQLQPSVFYHWQRRLCDHAVFAFTRGQDLLPAWS